MKDADRFHPMEISLHFLWGIQMYKYERIIYWSEDDDAFIVEVPELPGCMADGKTISEAIANSEVIIQEWIETALERGMKAPEPKGRLPHI